VGGKTIAGPVTAPKCLDPLWEGNSKVAVQNASVSILRTDEEAATQVEDLLPNALRAAPETVPLIAFTAGPQNSTSRRLEQPMLHQTREKKSMTEKNSGPQEAIKGVVEDVKGKAKEALGTVIGRDDVQREGKAQQDKAEAQRDAAGKEAEAEKARAQAAIHEKQQKSHQNG
jgi:uncharacterized protein YjbJ (UPF0337 family)